MNQNQENNNVRDLRILKEELRYWEIVQRIEKARFEALLYKIKYFELVGKISSENEKNDAKTSDNNANMSDNTNNENSNS